MKICLGPPPLYDRIVAAFPEASEHGVIFTFGETIYSPTVRRISTTTMKHEEVHAERQTNDCFKILEWWERYLVDAQFRLDEELPAHRAEYRAYCKRHGSGREKFLHVVATRLASPLYGAYERRTTRPSIFARGQGTDQRPKHSHPDGGSHAGR
jgi:hypothetical protein